MKKLFFILILFSIIFTACEPEVKGNPDRFKLGVFEVPGKDGVVSKSTIIRIDSLQIEKYTKYREISTDSGVFVKEEKRIDTFYIKWKNNFFYTLRMKSPKTDLDKELASFQITKIKANSYDFSMKIGYSKYKQEGTVYKIK
ncbi:hypothetical protein AAON49_01255 [Pseudotenacibaculum sp. MALMAid0570]|uniref:hypothetical protein n=1 Tax=Pseudotenacibaculum sp. MALMAid0570 TaxID=3143938 RepID=UPI0032DF3D72